MTYEREEYKADEFIYFIVEGTGEFEEINTKTGKRMIEKQISKDITFDDIEKLNLDTRGECVPFTQKHVINTPTYMLYYWTPIMGAGPCMTYLQLLTYCREDRDFAWPKMSELEEKLCCTRPTLIKYLNILEKNNFIIIVRRLNKLANSKETSSIIKIRQTIPLLSEEQLFSFSPSLRKKHEDFMLKYGRGVSVDRFRYESEETLSELLENSSVVISNRNRNKIKKMEQEESEIEIVSSMLSDYEKTKSEELLVEIKNCITKPTFDSVFSESFLILNEVSMTVTLITNDFGSDIINFNLSRYFSDIKLSLDQVFKKEILHFDCTSYKKFIKKGMA